MKLWVRLAAEGIQNLPLLTGFMLALELAKGGNWLGAVGCVVVASATAAVVIRLTEHWIFQGHYEPVRAVIGNIIAFSLLMLVAILYLTASWTRWWTDLVAGLVIGAVLEGAQELAARDRFGWARALSFGLACAITILLIRWLSAAPLGLSVLAGTIWCTGVIGLYNETQIKKQRAAVAAVEAVATADSTGCEPGR